MFSSSQILDNTSFSGSTNVGENINDEWFIVYLLMQLSKHHNDVIIRCISLVSTLLLLPFFFFFSSTGKSHKHHGLCRIYYFKKFWIANDDSAWFLSSFRITDSDGCFLLIEAAEYLPRWVKPDNSENRVSWIYYTNGSQNYGHVVGCLLG